MSLDLTTILTKQDPEPAYIVNGLLYQGQMITIAGEPGVGKSFLMYTLSMCLAAEMPFLGLPTVYGPVLYFDEENGGQDLTQYLRWAWRGLRCPAVEKLKDKLFIEHFSLGKEGKKRYEYMAKVAAAIKPLLIVVDTATPACGIEDENDNAQASRAIAGLRVVKGAAGLQAAMVVLKHAKLDDMGTSRTIRGAKAWLGALDGVIFHSTSPGQPRRDGLRNSRLIPDKVRAFGLRDVIKIVPSWTGQNNEKGISLSMRKD